MVFLTACGGEKKKHCICNDASACFCARACSATPSFCSFYRSSCLNPRMQEISCQFVSILHVQTVFLCDQSARLSTEKEEVQLRGCVFALDSISLLFHRGHFATAHKSQPTSRRHPSPRRTERNTHGKCSPLGRGTLDWHSSFTHKCRVLKVEHTHLQSAGRTQQFFVFLDSVQSVSFYRGWARKPINE